MSVVGRAVSRRQACGLVAFSALMLSGRPARAAEASLAVAWQTAGGQVLDTRTLSLADLDRLPQASLTTQTPWTTEPQTFTGPLLSTLAALGGAASAAEIEALNDYSAHVPATDWTQYGIVLSTRIDGRTLRVRDRGPFWLIYPLSQMPELDQQIYHARMVWQIRRIAFIAA